MTITKTPKKICEVCDNKALLDTFHTRTIENKELSMCSQCVEHVEGDDQKLSDLEAVSKKCHGHKAKKQNTPTNRRNQKLNKKSKSREKFRY